MPQYHYLNTPQQVEHFLAVVESRKARGVPTTVCFQVPESAERRTIDQNALFQIWAREYACFLLNKRTITEDEHENMKYTLQRYCYAETGWEYLIGHKRDLFTGKSRPERARTRYFDKGEMHQFLSWVQANAAMRGLILESQGEYAELQRSQNA